MTYKKAENISRFKNIMFGSILMSLNKRYVFKGFGLLLI